MSWLNRVRNALPFTPKRDTPDNLWIKCPDSGQMVFHKDVEANGFVIPGSDHHMRVTAPDRLRGRVVSFFTSARFGFDALGGLIAGVLATALGAGVTLALEGGVLLGFVLFLLSRRRALRQAIDRHDPAVH